MAFDPLERSASSGRPEELYEFWMADKYWRYTSGDTATVFNGYTYEPVRVLRRTALKQNKDGGDDSITITVPMDLEVAWSFRIVVPARTTWLRIYRRHRGDGDNFIQSWYGRVRGVAWKGSKAVLECDGLNSLFKRAGLRLNFDVKCPHMLYGPGCNLDKDQWRVDGTIMEIGANFVRSAAFASVPDGWLKLGYIEFGRYYYTLSGHTGDMVTTFQGLEYDIDDTPITVTGYAGCDRQIDTCWDKFGNGLNSEADAWFPNKNPFQTGI